ncbi:MAG: hypothetical protein ACRCXY_11455 [Fusobacteriaceae bacterium]
MIFQLDLYATYFLPYNSLKVQTIRNMIPNPTSFMYNDSILESVPLSYKEKELVAITYPVTVGEVFSVYNLPINSNSLIIEKKISHLKFYNHTQNLYYVFNGERDDKRNILLMPVLTTEGTSEYTTTLKPATGSRKYN